MFRIYTCVRKRKILSAWIIAKLLKIFLQSLSQEVYKRICAEVEAELERLLGCDHINLANVLGICWKPVNSRLLPYIIYEGCEIYFSDYLIKKRGKLKDSEIINIWIQILNGMIYLEKKSIMNTIHPLLIC